MNIDGTQKKLDALLGNLNVLMAGDGKGNEGVLAAVKQLNIIMARIAKVTDKDELNILMRELVGTVVALRQTITSIQGDTSATFENLKQASEKLNEFSRIARVNRPLVLFWSEPPAKITPPMNGVGASGAQK